MSSYSVRSNFFIKILRGVREVFTFVKIEFIDERKAVTIIQRGLSRCALLIDSFRQWDFC